MSIVIFRPDMFSIGENYSVSSAYEHTFIGKCVDFKPDLVVFESVFGKISITPNMVVTDDYRFERINMASRYDEMKPFTETNGV